MAQIVCENLVKVFGGGRPVRALDGLTLSVEEGEVFGLLGPNGSGKTTFVRCCLSIIFPSSGRLRVLGRRPGHPASMRLIGYLPENYSFYDHLTGHSFLYYHAELAGVPLAERRRRVEQVLEDVHLDPSASRRRMRTYSKGMLQRVGLAQAMIARPRLLFLDEPQSGLDPIGRRHVKDVMRKAAGEGVTVLFSSHVLADVEDVADRVAIIDKGRVRKVAALDQLILRTNRVFVRLRPPEPIRAQGSGVDEQVYEQIGRIVDGISAGGFEYANGVFSCTVKKEDDIPKLVCGLARLGYDIFEVTQERMTLEEVFLKEFGELPLNRTGALQSIHRAS